MLKPIQAGRNRRLAVTVVFMAFAACVFLFLRRGANAVLPVSFTDYTLSPDGQWCVVPQYDEDKSHGQRRLALGIVDADKRNGVQPIAGTETAIGPAWAVDSRTIYCAYTAPGLKFKTLTAIGRKNVLNAHPIEEVVRVEGNAAVNHPSPSPDGLHLAYRESRFIEGRGVVDTVHIRNLQNGKDVRLPLPPYGIPVSLQWSGDGKVLAYKTGVYKKAGSQGIVFHSADSGWKPQFVPRPLDQGAFALSPDGKMAALLSAGIGRRGTNNTLSFVTPAGKEVLKIHRSSIAPAMVWSQDSRYLCFVEGLFSGGVGVSRVETATGRVSLLVPRLNGKRIALAGRHKNTLFYSTSETATTSRLLTVAIQ